MEFRKIFDTIPEQFDKYRPRYSPELFASLIEYAEIGEGKTVLELGPGTGQATDPILGTGCDYNAIELGEHLYEKMKQKYGHYPNFHIVNDDFITHDFGDRKYDMIYSAATIQWIPEEIAFAKTFDILKPGGTLVINSSIIDRKSVREDVTVVYCDAMGIAEQVKNPKGANVAILGAMLAKEPIVGLDKMEEAIKIELGEKKMRFFEGNKAALLAGLEAAK